MREKKGTTPAVIVPNVSLVSVLQSLTTTQRKQILLRSLKKYSGKDFRCPALGKVRIVADSVRETAHHASKSAKSTLAALNLKSVIEGALYVYATRKPKANKQTKKNKFEELYELHVNVYGVGAVKLMVGRNTQKLSVHYCCTSLSED